MTTFWAAHAWLPAGLHENVRIEVADGVIVTAAAGTPAQPSDIRLPGVVFPGFANAHSHAFHRALRGRTHTGRGSFWTWREAMYALAARLTPDTYYQLALATYAEMALAGVSVVGEFHYLHHGPGGTPYADPNAMTAALRQAAADAGIRLTLLDACYLTGGIDRPLDGVQRRFGDGTADAWAARADQLADADDDGFRVGAAIHSVRAVPPAAIDTVAAWADRYDRPLHVHLSEQPAENEAALTAYGRTPTQLLADHGAFTTRTTAVHANHVTPDDITLLGAAGTTICACPTTEQDLADGLAPTGLLAAAGSLLCVGSDQHAVADLLLEARLLEHHERLRTGERGTFDAAALVAALTENGHTALGWPGNGRLVPGAAADLVAVRTDTVRTAGADPAQLVFAAGAADVDTVVVGGRTVVSGGTHQRGDVPSLLARAIAPLWD
ncbi:formimidoylglutamate deiminase [Jiangella rhizosphaerae]|uniref:Formimidoylglutamate deiminase n=1 Tax=Jiangella rhizosphaerae TaxID=2293569 RepID=A0A418KGJ9_9ACTN|nr:formimidoylglutamate deiminase [Jiangella rhizosphaerae]RIQ11106.1 formimidoylglutamate deiminase [Jiangella rhizosphaerae]